MSLECTLMFMKLMLYLSIAFETKNVTNAKAYPANINEIIEIYGNTETL